MIGTKLALSVLDSTLKLPTTLPIFIFSSSLRHSLCLCMSRLISLIVLSSERKAEVEQIDCIDYSSKHILEDSHKVRRNSPVVNSHVLYALNAYIRIVVYATIYSHYMPSPLTSS